MVRIPIQHLDWRNIHNGTRPCSVSWCPRKNITGKGIENTRKGIIYPLCQAHYEDMQVDPVRFGKHHVLVLK